MTKVLIGLLLGAVCFLAGAATALWLNTPDTTAPTWGIPIPKATAKAVKGGTFESFGATVGSIANRYDTNPCNE